MPEKNISSRWHHLYHIWNSLIKEPELPQLDKWLSNVFAKNKSYGSKDRRWYSDLIFAAIRHGYFALFCLIHGANADLDDLKSTSLFSEKFDSFEKLKQGLSDHSVESFFQWVVKIKESSCDFSPPKTLWGKMLLHSIPLWLQDDLQARIHSSQWSSADVDAFLQSQDSRPPLWIRLNHTEKADVVLNELACQQFAVEQISESTLKIEGLKGIFGLSSFQNGLFEIQDLASQQIGAHVAAKPGQYVWDCCAGGGGKTIQVASALKNKGAVYASDVRAYKLEEIKRRARKAQFFNIRCFQWDGLLKEATTFPKEIANRGGFDWVLVDAPCSATGTWRRNPDAKYRASAEHVDQLCALQLSILERASLSVTEKGSLVYSTCSFLVKENETVVEKFLERNPSFQLIKSNLLGSPMTNADTMFACILRKK